LNGETALDFNQGRHFMTIACSSLTRLSQWCVFLGSLLLLAGLLVNLMAVPGDAFFVLTDLTVTDNFGAIPCDTPEITLREGSTVRWQWNIQCSEGPEAEPNYLMTSWLDAHWNTGLVFSAGQRRTGHDGR
jgi:hypothetical protein